MIYIKSPNDKSFTDDFKFNLSLNEGSFGSVCTLISPRTRALRKLKISRERQPKRLQSTKKILKDNRKIGIFANLLKLNHTKF
jgi:hypothetical protein